MTKVHKLSNRQERELLQRLMQCKPVDNGSSRLLFIDPRDSNYVIKVAVGAKAFRQNKLEVAMYKTWGASGYLAEIKEYGNFCIVMERLAEIYCSDELEDYYFPEGHPSYAVQEWMDQLLGYTSDNCQIGKTKHGEWVAYDYGFDPSHSSQVQVGWASDLRWSQGWRDYLVKARSLLLQKRPITQCEKWYAELCQ